MTQAVQLPIAVNTELYIGGKAVSASDGGRFDVLDPSTGQPVASVADGTVDDALAAVAAAHRPGRLGRDARRASARRSCGRRSRR